MRYCFKYFKGKNMKKRRFYTIISLILLLSMLTSCAGTVKDTVANADESSDSVQATEPETEPETETETEPEPETEPETEPEEPEILNRNDTFVKDTITVNNSDFVIPEEQQQALYDAMNYSYYRYYDVAFYVIDLGSRMSFGYNADDYFEPACTRKAGLALSWYIVLEDNRKKREAEIPSLHPEDKFSLYDKYYYDGSDYMSGAGYIGRHGSRSYTIREILHYLLYNSDNTAYKILWNLLGIQRYKLLERELGIPKHKDDFARDKFWTPMRAHDIGLIWQKIWEYKSASPEGEILWYELTHNEFCEIGKVVLDADEIAHKSGSDDYGFHEAGIVVRGDNAYAVVAFSTVPLPVANDNYDCIHMVIERIDPVMKYFYSGQWQNE